MSSPRVLQMPPLLSDTPMIVAPSSLSRRAATLRADDDADLGGIPAGHVLQLAHRHLLGIADHAALAAAVRDVGRGALPGHPGRQRLDLVEGDAGVIADAALGGTARQVVLHPVA